jgi:N-acetylmuramoyl-L-alanine amidase
MTNFEHLRSLLSHPRMTKKHIGPFIRRHKGMIIGQVVILTVLLVLVINSAFGGHLFNAFAAISCPNGEAVYTIVPGDTLGTIAANHGTTWQNLAQHNQIANPNLIYAFQQICIPGSNTSTSTPNSSSNTPSHNTTNPFPYGQCTWWASQRYHDLHGYFVPWTTQSDAWQWTARAQEFGWHVSDKPSYGAIIDFQPGVQGASNSGHVAVVEQILNNGDVVASNMNVQGYAFGSVVNLTYHSGPGVTFITA